MRFTCSAGRPSIFPHQMKHSALVLVWLSTGLGANPAQNEVTVSPQEASVLDCLPFSPLPSTAMQHWNCHHRGRDRQEGRQEDIQKDPTIAMHDVPAARVGKFTFGVTFRCIMLEVVTFSITS